MVPSASNKALLAKVMEAKKEFAAKFPDNPFISIADHDRRIDRDFGYPVPYRCLYSVNVPNLFMAGRNISVTDEALGTVRVMKTIGMMGEVVGKAAYIAAKHNATNREVYALYWSEMDDLLKLLENPASDLVPLLRAVPPASRAVRRFVRARGG